MYYEAIIQLRPADKEILKFVNKQIRKQKGKVSIAKIVELKTGVDIYLTSQRFALSLGRVLKKSFKGELKITRSLYKISRITSKKIYRLTVCFRKQ